MFSTALFDDRTDRWTAVAARTLSGAASLRVTSIYTVMLLAVSLTLTAMGPHARAVAVSRMSTNLHNLAHGRVGTLIGSAFVNDGDDVFFWLPGLVCLLALGEAIWRSTGLVVTFAVGHIGATLLVAVGLVAAVRTGSLPSSIARASDVGTSYGAVCVLGALTASIPARWRPVWVGWWLGVALPASLSADFTAIGHMLALLLGIGLSFRLRSMARWTPQHVTLLVVGAAFGFLVLSGPSMVAPVWGLAGALIAQLMRRISPSTASPVCVP
ncbi:rhomboid-like protein [Mycobacterium sp.]|uniref:rhomboid-like protein n=1 Tax=Mycobacterium sp. TaxID=1785 RepID=UPI003F94C506